MSAETLMRRISFVLAFLCVIAATLMLYEGEYSVAALNAATVVFVLYTMPKAKP